MKSALKFSIGYHPTDIYCFADVVAKYSADILEVYFPWSGVPSGRGISNVNDQAQMEDELRDIHDRGIKLNLLWNANCYGGKAISVDLDQQIVSTVDYLLKHIGLEVITTTSLFIAEVVKSYFPQIDIRASINMGIGTVSGMNYVKDYFDSFYLQREFNRFPAHIKLLRSWCDTNGKKLYLLANSGCLKNCSAHTFHDNLVAHEHELGSQPNRWGGFRGVCWNYYSDSANHAAFLHGSTWVRPEDLSAYDGLIDGIKLATRSHRDPALVIESYVRRRFEGNMLSLCEPDFSSLADIDNAVFPSCWMERLENLSESEQEQYCKEVFSYVKR